MVALHYFPPKDSNIASEIRSTRSSREAVHVQQLGAGTSTTFSPRYGHSAPHEGILAQKVAGWVYPNEQNIFLMDHSDTTSLCIGLKTMLNTKPGRQIEERFKPSPSPSQVSVIYPRSMFASIITSWLRDFFFVIRPSKHHP